MSLVSKSSALAISLIIGVVLAFVFFQGLSTDSYFEYDEFYSLSRSAGFIKHDDWLRVYSRNEPSAKKPPLQYWLNALNLKLNLPELLACRLWSYFFLLGAIVATGFLAARLCRGNPWVLPATMLLTAGSQQLILAGRSAMLDSGQCFFVMTALVAFFYAKDNAGWWLVCGAMAGLGALQKAPVAIVFIAILLFTLNRRQDSYYRWQNLRQLQQFNTGYYLAWFLLMSWPVLQTVLEGSAYLKVGIQQEMLGRVTPLGDERLQSGDFFNWLAWLWADIGITGVLAIACALLMLITKKWRTDNAVFALAVVVAAVMIGFSLATGKLYPRYLVILSPLLIVMLVKYADAVLPWQPTILALAIAITVVSVPRLQAAIEHAGKPDTFYKAKESVEHLDAVREPQDVLFVDSGVLPAGAYGYFGSSAKPYYSRKLMDESDLARGKRELAILAEPVSGVTSLQNIDLIEKMVGAYQVLYRDAEIVVWRRPAQR